MIQRSVIIQLAGKKICKWLDPWSISIAIRTRRTVILRLILEVESLSWKFQTGWNSFISANSVRWNWGAFPSLSLFLSFLLPSILFLRLSLNYDCRAINFNGEGNKLVNPRFSRWLTFHRSISAFSAIPFSKLSRRDF